MVEMVCFDRRSSGLAGRASQCAFLLLMASACVSEQPTPTVQAPSTGGTSNIGGQSSASGGTGGSWPMGGSGAPGGSGGTAGTDGTGEVLCTEGDGRKGIPGGFASWPMPNPPDSGLPNAQQHVDSPGGAVQDLVTGLMWESTSTGDFTFDDALTRCDSLDAHGFADWRLPSRIEMLSLDDSTVVHWTASRDSFSMTPRSWNVLGPSAARSPTTAQLGVRCVRTEASASLATNCRFFVENETARDLGTGLTWPIKPFGLATHAESEDYCAGLERGGHDDWRLPSARELQTLVHEGRYLPAAPDDVFPLPGDEYWTNTFVNTDVVYTVDFKYGETSSAYPTDDLFARCVRP